MPGGVTSMQTSSVSKWKTNQAAVKLPELNPKGS
jgi:hypothetical protein